MAKLGIYGVSFLPRGVVGWLAVFDLAFPIIKPRHVISDNVAF